MILIGALKSLLRLVNPTPQLRAARAALLLPVLLVFTPAQADAAEVVRLDERNWAAYAPEGKEVDAIYGDWVLRSDRIIAVIADTIDGRNANMTVRNVGGAVIDLTDRREPNDQLGAFYPAPRGHHLRAVDHRVESDGTAVLICRNEPAEDAPEVEVEYRLADGAPFLRVRSRILNTTGLPLDLALRDEMRADAVFESGQDEEGRVAWVYDRWFRQAYGVLAEDENLAVTIGAGGARRPWFVQYRRNGQTRARLEPGEELAFERLLFCAPDTLSLRALAAGHMEKPLRPASLSVRDADGPVAGALVEVRVDGESYGAGHTGEDGRLKAALPQGRVQFSVESLGRTPRTAEAEQVSGSLELQIEMDQPGYAVARITCVEGGPIPCKVQFLGKGQTSTPYFFHEAGEHAVHNLFYSHNGQFRQPLGPGTYDVIISYGPEYDAVFTEIEIQRGRETPFQATLNRVVDSRGWISSELHSHSTPSGDTVASQRGRVLNLLAEHLEFAPCTEHNRVDTYQPHLEALGVEHLMATCPGIELTGSPLPLNHQNAFPMMHKPRTQDGGGPQAHPDPVEQVTRLYYWDEGAEKLMQKNHPNIIQMFFDSNLDGRPDEALRPILPFLDVIEVHPPHRILEAADVKDGINTGGNRMNSWLQMINQGMWLPGVVNTDAHWNHHGSGWLRNYIFSPVDDPAKVEIMHLVRSLRKGRVIMSNGPFMEVTLETVSGGSRGLPGDIVFAPDGKTELHVRVQCSNWLDIDRVQVLVNGRRPTELNFTRESHSNWFADGVVKFDRTIPLELEEAAHIIVVAIGENTTLGPVMGDNRGRANPVAVSNPIFVDLDGGGFQPNGDTLDAPLAVK